MDQATSNTDQSPHNDSVNKASEVPTTKEPLKHLEFISDNDDQEVTIVLIHGAAASASDWSLVVPYLSTYHILRPSLFTTSSLDIVRQSRSSGRINGETTSRPRTWISSYAFHLAELIKRHAKNGRAHIVGLSFGGCLAVEFATSYHALCSSLLVSGLPAVRSSMPSIARPLGTAVMWTMHSISKAVGADGVNMFLEGQVKTDPGFWDGKGGGATIELNGILSATFIYSSQTGKCPYLSQLDAHNPAKWSTEQEFRIRLIAATRTSKWTPASDSPDLATEIAAMMMKQDKNVSASDKSSPVQAVDCRVYVAKRMFHPWNRQDPELFAQCILSTINGALFPATTLQEVWKYSHSLEVVQQKSP